MFPSLLRLKDSWQDQIFYSYTMNLQTKRHHLSKNIASTWTHLHHIIKLKVDVAMSPEVAEGFEVAVVAVAINPEIVLPVLHLAMRGHTV